MKKFLIYILFFFFSCQVETSTEVLDNLLDTNSFKICEISYGGFAGRGVTSFKFENQKDSIAVVSVRGKSYMPIEENKFKLSHDEFDLVKQQLRCMTQLHIDEEVISSGCQPPFYSEYFLHSKFRTIRIYPSIQDTCSFRKILYPKYVRKGLLDD